MTIKSFRRRGLERFFQSGSKAGIQPKHARKLRLQLFALDNAKGPHDLNAPGWDLRPLVGALRDHWAICVSGNWRVTFKFENEDAILVDYQDYHQESLCTTRPIPDWFFASISGTRPFPAQQSISAQRALLCRVCSTAKPASRRTWRSVWQ